MGSDLEISGVAGRTRRREVGRPSGGEDCSRRRRGLARVLAPPPAVPVNSAVSRTPRTAPGAGGRPDSHARLGPGIWCPRGDTVHTYTAFGGCLVSCDLGRGCLTSIPAQCIAQIPHRARWGRRPAPLIGGGRPIRWEPEEVRGRAPHARDRGPRTGDQRRPRHRLRPAHAGPLGDRLVRALLVDLLIETLRRRVDARGA
jgi:hypothetical protein